MKLHTLKPSAGATKKKKRIARGQGSGTGGTSTRGHKGAKSRSGYKSKRNFEGGQMPLQMRLPKRGFNNVNRVDYVPMNLFQLQHWADKYETTTLDVDFFKSKRIVKKTDLVKILANGELTAALTVSAHAFSAKAKAAIEEKGGTVQVL